MCPPSGTTGAEEWLNTSGRMRDGISTGPGTSRGTTPPSRRPQYAEKSRTWGTGRRHRTPTDDIATRTEGRTTRCRRTAPASIRRRRGDRSIDNPGSEAGLMVCSVSGGGPPPERWIPATSPPTMYPNKNRLHRGGRQTTPCAQTAPTSCGDDLERMDPGVRTRQTNGRGLPLPRSRSATPGRSLGAAHEHREVSRRRLGV